MVLLKYVRKGLKSSPRIGILHRILFLSRVILFFNTEFPFVSYDLLHNSCLCKHLGICNSSYGTCVLCCLFLFCVVYSILSRELYGFIFPWKILWNADTGIGWLEYRVDWPYSAGVFWGSLCLLFLLACWVEILHP